MQKPPFFVVGAGRSGTTMLRLMLCGHDSLFIPPEAWFLGEVMWRLPSSGPLSKNDLAECERLILSGDRWKDWKCPEEKLRGILQGCAELDLASVIDRLFREVFDLPHDVRWGEKTPKHSYIVERIGEIFPAGQFIHLIRDGRDVASSLLARGWFGANPRRVAEHWDGCVRGADKAKLFGADRYMEVRFEDLVADPEREIRKVCAFLDVPFEPRMLAFQNQVSKFVPAGETLLHEKLRGKVSFEEVGKWRSVLTGWHQAVFWVTAGASMKRHYTAAKPAFLSRVLFGPALLACSVERWWSVFLSKLRS